MLLPEDLRLLITLQDNPLGTYNELASVLGITPPTVKARLLRLCEKLDSTPDPHIPTILVRADLNLKALGLEMLNVMVQTSSLRMTKQLEKVIRQHPFVSYQVRCMGKNQGLYTQFRIPKGTSPKIQNFFSQIQQQKPGLVERFHFFPTHELSVYTNFDLQAWSEEDNTWVFDWQKWISGIDSVPSEPWNTSQTKQPKLVLNQLTNFDLQILQEVTWNARRRNKELISILSTDYRYNNGSNTSRTIEPYQMTRRLKFLNEQVITGYRVHPNWKIFNIFDSLLFLCRVPRDVAYKWAQLLRRNPIPFQSTFQVLSNGFLWFIGCPSTQFSEISEVIWEYTSDFDLYLLDYRSSVVYEIWWKIFDENTKSWRIDDNFMIDTPLKELETIS
ncbi:MAG: winged helix-turn-helix transcriptional regulator [Candidatus Hodarchaeota archaeon]